MDSGKRKANCANPRETANIFSIMFMTYSREIYKKSIFKDFTQEDLWEPLKNHRSEFLGKLLESKWKKELTQYKNTGRRPSFLRALLKTFSWKIIITGLVSLANETCLRLGQPILLGRFLRYFSHNEDTPFEAAVLCGVGLILLTVAYAFVLAHYGLNVDILSMEIRVALSYVVYGKVFRLSSAAARNPVGGNIINMLSSDLKTLPFCMWVIHYGWITPPLLCVLIYAIWSLSGWPGMFGVGIYILLTVMMLPTGYLGFNYRRSSAEKADKRIKIIGEILLGIRLIKMYTWEKPFLSLVSLVRKYEMKFAKKNNRLRGIFLAYNLFTFRLACYSVMVMNAFFENDYTAENVFTVAAFFASVMSLTSFFIRACQELSEKIACFKRTEKFLLQEELPAIPDVKITGEKDTSDEAVALSNVTASWDQCRTERTLSNINLRAENGSLVAIIGSVGSGKSSVLQAILGELPLLSGSVNVQGTVSYASQEPWIFSDTIRQNITFSKPYKKELYDEVVRVCALEPDFLQLPHGDMTRVGEKGCSLSGGQKARINLARAVYHGGNVYLFDDPLSAVDTRVAKQLFEECIVSFLKGKTRLLVTHQLQYIKDADHIVVVKSGRVEVQGSFSDITKSNIDIAIDLNFHENLRNDKEEAYWMLEDTVKGTTEANCDSTLKKTDDTCEQNLNISACNEYIRSGSSYFALIVVVLMFVLTQSAANVSDYWLSYWTRCEKKRASDRYHYSVSSHTGKNITLQESKFYSSETVYFQEEWICSREFCLSVHSMIIIAILLFCIGKTRNFYNLCDACSNGIHNQVMNSLIRTPIRFFDINPSGRVLNRFSTDIGVIDDSLPRAAMDCWHNSLVVIASILLACIFNVWLLIVLLLMAVLVYFVGWMYFQTARNLGKLEGICRSPVFVHLNATIEGLPTIRALRAEDLIKREWDRHQDCFTSTTYSIHVVNKTLSMCIDLICSFFFAGVVIGFLAKGKEYYSGDVGFVVIQCFELVTWLQLSVITFAGLFESMALVERIVEYKYLEEEENLDTTTHNFAPPRWPKFGCIQFQNMTLKYIKDGPSVLKDVNVIINSGEKVGIVGRTGAGKSSLILALFRLARVEGCILIDGVDTSAISLHELRKNISIIPQDPFLFSGTLRENLDRFGEFQDYELLRALEDVELKEILTNKTGLSMEVADKGDNFSVGQKQLLCLARAIMRNNKILVLDEATANVDLRTDELIQRTIRVKFAHCTVLTVAHRLNTIMDSDKVMVMDRGHLMEFDHPHVLLQNTESLFHKMVEKTGQMNILARVASESYSRLK